MHSQKCGPHQIYKEVSLLLRPNNFFVILEKYLICNEETFDL